MSKWPCLKENACINSKPEDVGHILPLSDEKYNLNQITTPISVALDYTGGGGGGGGGSEAGGFGGVGSLKKQPVNFYAQTTYYIFKQPEQAYNKIGGKRNHAYRLLSENGF